MITFYAMVAFVPVNLALLYRWPRLWHLLLALYLGLLVGLTDLRTDDPQLPILLLMTFGLFLGFDQPAGAWRWAIALGVWVPIIGIIAHGLRLSSAQLNDVLFSIVALVPAFVGVYTGAFVRRFSARHATAA
jgi:hypothetical protein